MYVWNSAPPRRTEGDYRYWRGLLPGDKSSLIATDPNDLVPFDQLPQVQNPSTGWVQNCNDSPWTSTYPIQMDMTGKYAAYTASPPSLGPRSMRSIRLLSESGKITLEDLMGMKLSTRGEYADHFVDDLVAEGQGSR
jgi:acyl-homoserine-lactone acylase